MWLSIDQDIGGLSRNMYHLGVSKFTGRWKGAQLAFFFLGVLIEPICVLGICTQDPKSKETNSLTSSLGKKKKEAQLLSKIVQDTVKMPDIGKKGKEQANQRETEKKNGQSPFPTRPHLFAFAGPEPAIRRGKSCSTTLSVLSPRRIPARFRGCRHNPLL